MASFVVEGTVSWFEHDLGLVSGAAVSVFRPGVAFEAVCGCRPEASLVASATVLGTFVWFAVL
ncbi:hypothetical protein C7C45_01800 [Micromonospora arborensis]|uniref:Uncharacterized protein n=1 Tax=Micromonospora arborensis TaxID=2116518 RepID=A0A318P9H5_9ACTN|nr:hypothetical protein C7C45_01800 [Micromonospora arborensis]